MTFEPISRTTFTRNEQGFAESLESQDYSTDSLKWITRLKLITAYDLNGNVIFLLDSLRLSNVLTEFSRRERVFDEMDRLISDKKSEFSNYLSLQEFNYSEEDLLTWKKTFSNTDDVISEDHILDKFYYSDNTTVSNKNEILANAFSDLYPNPTHGTVWIKGDLSLIGHYKWYQMSGQLISAGKLDSNKLSVPNSHHSTNLILVLQSKDKGQQQTHIISRLR